MFPSLSLSLSTTVKVFGGFQNLWQLVEERVFLPFFYFQDTLNDTIYVNLEEHSSHTAKLEQVNRYTYHFLKYFKIFLGHIPANY